MTAPALAVGDGPLGFCKPLCETFPESSSTAMSHRMANVLAALPKSAQPGATAALAEI
jgi:putative transposase